MTRSTILFASEYHPPFAPGGAEWSNVAWARALVRRGHRVVVVTLDYGAARREDADGVTVIRVPFPVKLAAGQHEAPWITHRNPLFHVYFGWRVAQAVRREGARVIHAQGKGALVGAWLAARARRVPIVATVRDTGFLCPLGLCPLFEPWETFDCSTRQYVDRCAPFFFRHYMPTARGVRRARIWISLLVAWADQKLRQAALARVNAVIGVSAGILAIHPRRLVDGGRARVVHTLPPDVVPPPDADVAAVRRRLRIGPGPLVVYAGKLSLGKGTPVLLDALDVVRAAVPGVRFAFAGKGEWPLPPAPDVHALGTVSQPDLFALYRAADVVVVPSSWPEPLSRVLLEAMRLGRPIVATAVGGTPEVVEDGVTGLLVPKGDAKALGTAIATVLGDGELRARMGEAAARRATEAFAAEPLVDALLDAYGLARRATA